MIEQYWPLQRNIMQSRSWAYSNYKWQRSHQTTYTYTVHPPKTQINHLEKWWLEDPCYFPCWTEFSTGQRFPVIFSGKRNHHLFQARIFPRNGASCGCWLSKYKRAILSSTAIWPDTVCHWRVFVGGFPGFEANLESVFGWRMIDGWGRQAISYIYNIYIKIINYTGNMFFCLVTLETERCSCNWTQSGSCLKKFPMIQLVMALGEVPQPMDLRGIPFNTHWNNQDL